MKPIDFRNETFEQVRERIQGELEAVQLAFAQHGPGTTREVSGRSGISLLTLRPRTTELVQIGALALVGKMKHEGIYAAVRTEVHRTWFDEEHKRAVGRQADLPLQMAQEARS